MRFKNSATLVSSLLLAGLAAQKGFNGLEPRFLPEDRAYRVECDNHMTVRPADSEYWKRMEKATLPFSEAAAAAERVMIEKLEYDSAKALTGELVILGNPFYKFEVFGHKVSEEGEAHTHRWKVSVGMRGKIKSLMRMERLPGTVVRDGEIETLESGVMVFDAREGDGQQIRADSEVRIHCMVTRLDNAIIQSTYEEREPMEFSMTNPPIAGLKELVGARVGGKRKLVIPPDLAFGEEGRGQLVPPFATLVYDIEVLRVR